MSATEPIGKNSQCPFSLDIQTASSNLVRPTVRVPTSLALIAKNCFLCALYLFIRVLAQCCITLANRLQLENYRIPFLFSTDPHKHVSIFWLVSTKGETCNLNVQKGRFYLGVDPGQHLTRKEVRGISWRGSLPFL